MEQTPDADDSTLLAAFREGARRAGLLGPSVAAAVPQAAGAAAMSAWIAAGHHGEMDYMARPAPDRSNPRSWAAWTRSVALLADPYPDRPAPPSDPARARFSRYARGDDYHNVLRRKLEDLCAPLRRAGRQALPFVDTSPLMEKALAAAGGLGWVGKNGNLLRRDRGSYFFLGGVATDACWAPTPTVEEGCGTCTSCIPACPTGAIVSPGVVDARLCISYLTIEIKGAIPRHLRPLLGNRVFGCDDCQEVCPWNEPSASGCDPAYLPRPGLAGPALLDLAQMTEAEFFARFRGSPARRPRWRGLLRNVMVALGNWGSIEALPALRHGLSHPESLVRAHAAWALGRLPGEEAGMALTGQLGAEADTAVLEEIRLALQDRQER